jgi:hypothetical protein
MIGHDGGRVSSCHEPVLWAAAHFEDDLLLAVTSELPVLILGSPAASREIAYELDHLSGCARGAIEVIDCRRAGAIEGLRYLTNHGGAGTPHERPRILLLEEVYALDRRGQAFLSMQLEHVRIHEHPTVRVVSSSSVPLCELVVMKEFDDRLYYRLNAIQVVVPERGVWH